jgi:hypothetical protein
LFQALFLDADNLYRKNGLTAALRIKLTEVLYVPWIWQWCSILLCQADASRPTNFCYPERTLPAGGELVQAFSGKYAPEHQIVHLELPTLQKPLVIALEHLAVQRILESCLPSCLIDQVNVITPELVLCGFIVCFNMGGDHGDFRGDNNFSHIHQEERHLPHGLA